MVQKKKWYCALVISIILIAAGPSSSLAKNSLAAEEITPGSGNIQKTSISPFMPLIKEGTSLVP